MEWKFALSGPYQILTSIREYIFMLQAVLDIICLVKRMNLLTIF